MPQLIKLCLISLVVSFSTKLVVVIPFYLAVIKPWLFSLSLSWTGMYVWSIVIMLSPEFVIIAYFLFRFYRIYRCKL